MQIVLAFHLCWEFSLFLLRELARWSVAFFEWLCHQSTYTVYVTYGVLEWSQSTRPVMKGYIHCFIVEVILSSDVMTKSYKECPVVFTTLFKERSEYGVVQYTVWSESARSCSKKKGAVPQTHWDVCTGLKADVKGFPFLLKCLETFTKYFLAFQSRTLWACLKKVVYFCIDSSC